MAQLCRPFNHNRGRTWTASFPPKCFLYISTFGHENLVGCDTDRSHAPLLLRKEAPKTVILDSYLDINATKIKWKVSCNSTQHNKTLIGQYNSTVITQICAISMRRSIPMCLNVLVFIARMTMSIWFSHCICNNGFLKPRVECRKDQVCHQIDLPRFHGITASLTTDIVWIHFSWMKLFHNCFLTMLDYNIGMVSFHCPVDM